MKKQLLITLLAFTTLLSCDTGDSLTDIFLSHPWKLSLFNDGGIRTPGNPAYVLQFYDGVFSVSTRSDATITGNWQADAKRRTFNCTKVRVNGSIAGDTIAQKIEKILKEAQYYEGDANYLQIQVQKNRYMQFHNK